MSTPPFVDLPDGVIADRWPVRGTERAVLHTRLADTDSWALLVPGFTGSKEDFIAVLPLLADVGIGAVAFDQLGQFESDGSDRAGDYDLSLLAGDVAEVAEHAARLGAGAGAGAAAVGPHLVGHSFGGLVAQRAVVDGLRPRSLVLLCTGPGALPAAAHPDLLRLRAAVEQVDLADIWPQLPASQRSMSAPVAEFVERRWRTNHPEHVREVARMLVEQPDLTALLAPTTSAVPTIVMWGSLDQTWPSAGQQPWAGVLGARAVELPGAGHSPNADDPGALVAALQAAWRSGGR